MKLLMFVCFSLLSFSVLAEEATPKGSMMLPAILGALLALSEVLALIPSVKSNSIFQLLWNILKSAVGK